MKWQPLDTAPEGVPVLGVDSHGAMTSIYLFRSACYNAETWFLCEPGTEAEDRTFEPTPWMPLPALPE